METNYKMLYSACGYTFEEGLRKLSYMTEEEVWEFVGGKSTLYEDVRITKLDKTGIEISYTIDAGEEGQYPQLHRVAFAAFMPKEFIWLLSKGFDLFGLIEAGLAIDKTTLPEAINKSL